MSWCSLCDAPHEPCERADLRYDCLACFKPIEEFDEVEVDGEFYHPGCINHCTCRIQTGSERNANGERVCETCGKPDRTAINTTPENVECPECDALVEEAMQWRDWQSLDMGVYCDKHTPENVEERTCTCVLVDAGSYLSPPEWAQDPDCPIHPASTPENVDSPTNQPTNQPRREQ